MPVMLDSRENFRNEDLTFEVADFEAAYHAILGRPALAKFMAVPHYTYMLMKLPGPNGVISLQGDVRRSYDCDQESCSIAENIRAKADRSHPSRRRRSSHKESSQENHARPVGPCQDGTDRDRPRRQ